jgi:hypothetical protein
MKDKHGWLIFQIIEILRKVHIKMEVVMLRLCSY